MIKAIFGEGWQLLTTGEKVLFLINSTFGGWLLGMLLCSFFIAGLTWWKWLLAFLGYLLVSASGQLWVGRRVAIRQGLKPNAKNSADMAEKAFG